MAIVKVDISDMQVSNRTDDVLVTYALGSCIAVVLYDPVRKVGGMIHYQLPLSKVNPNKATERPGMFADTGVPLLFERVYLLGGVKQSLVVKVAGGGQLCDDNGTFEIGKRNYTMLRKMLWKNNVMIAAEDVGGHKSRTVRLYLDTGRVTVNSQREETEL